MKKLPRVASIVLIGVTAFAAVSTAFAAWISANPMPAICPPLGSGTDTGFISSADGDVVTTNRWNLSACAIVRLLEAVGDFPVMNNPSFQFFSNSSNAGRTLIGKMNLPSASSIVGDTLGFAGGIYWKDPAASYSSNNVNTYKGGIVYNEIDKQLHMRGFSGGLSLSPNFAKKYVVGWVDVDLDKATEYFDAECQYRFQTDHAIRWYYPNVVIADSLLISQDDNWADSVFTPIELRILFNEKRTIFNRMMNLPNLSHWQLIRIQKLCLPSYPDA